MVVLHIKRDSKSAFLFETRLDATVAETTAEVVAVYNGRLKVLRVCNEVADLAEHGVRAAPAMDGLLDEQIKELKLEDPERERCKPEGGSGGASRDNPDPTRKRTGDAPNKENKEKVLDRTVAEVKCRMDAEENVKGGVALTFKVVRECLDILGGAVSIVYPMGLPEYDPVRMELENREELEGTQASKEVIDPTDATLWFANNEMKPENKLSGHLGKNEKTKVVVKVSTRRGGQPVSESWLDEENQKKIALMNYRRMEELRRLEKDNDNSYLNSTWADGSSLRRKFQGMNNISWK